MRAHPDIDLVSRDPGGDYAAGARDGAPQATQIADRFHMYQNLVEAVELTLARRRCRNPQRRCSRLIRRRKKGGGADFRLPTECVCVEHWKPGSPVLLVEPRFQSLPDPILALCHEHRDPWS